MAKTVCGGAKWRNARLSGSPEAADTGEIDRRRLGARVFADRREMEKLNAIVWPVIIDMVWDELRKAAGGTEEKPAEPLIGVVEAAGAVPCPLAAPRPRSGPLLRRSQRATAAVLIEAGWYKHFDEVWVTHVPVEEAVRRLMERNGLSEEDALTRVRAQMPAEERLQHATVRVDTTGSLEETAGLLTREWEALLRDRAAPGFPSPSAM